MIIVTNRGSLYREWPVRWAHILAWFGAAIYLIQAFLYAHTTTSRLDEGDYLYKGILFATGQYHPFELYGVWMDKAPLAFNSRIHRINFWPRLANLPLFGNLLGRSNPVGSVGGSTANQS